MEQNYFVYKLFNPDCTEFYIGSTKDMKARKARHKSNCNSENSPKYNMTLYQYIRSNGGYSSWSYEILEHIRNSINVYELRNVERKYIEQLKPGLNCDIPNRTKKQYYEDNKENIKQRHKQYRENNRDILNERQRQKFNCECGGKYTRVHKARHEKSKKHRDFIN